MTKTRLPKISPSYLRLIAQFPLRAIDGAKHYTAATAMVEHLAVRGEDALDSGETDYLGALATLIEAYDQQHYAEVGARSGPVELLKHLMEERGMSTADVGRILGSRSAASMILSGARELSKSQIAALSGHFNIAPGAFLPENPPRQIADRHPRKSA